jgi:hypothetical protein
VTFARVLRARHAFAGTFPMMDTINKRWKTRETISCQEREQPTVFSIDVHPRSLGAANSLTAFRLRRSPREEKEIIYRKFAVAGTFGALRKFHLGIVLEQFQGSIEARMYERASHYPFPRSFVAPAGFALERLRYAKRVYEKTAR